MNIEPGVSIENVQLAICSGKEYGRKKWSEAEQQEACHRYEELTGIKPNTSSIQSANYSVLLVLAVAILIVIFVYTYRRKSSKIRRKNS